METKKYSNVLETGYKLGNYEILSRLGEGGFGITYKAKHIHLETVVVIKEYMPSSMAVRDSDSITITVSSQENIENYQFGLKKFLSEAKILASLKHPNIVGINDFFEANNTAYFVMPFVDGITLSQYVHYMDNELNEEKLLKLLIPILEGLNETHSKGILHRDIKPDNIFVTKDNVPILIDFGAARIDFAKKSENVNAILTPPYAPAEQYGSSKQGAWTDIYALGMVLYKLVTKLKSADIPASIDRVTAIYSGEVDPLEAMNNPNFTRNFKELILKALSVNSKDRFQSAIEMKEAFVNIDSSVSEQTIMIDTSQTEDYDRTLMVEKNQPKSKGTIIIDKREIKDNNPTQIRNEKIELLSSYPEKKSNKSFIAIGIFSLLLISAGAFCFVTDNCLNEENKKDTTVSKDVNIKEKFTDKVEKHPNNKAYAFSADEALKKGIKLLESDAIEESKEYFNMADVQGNIKAKVYLGQIAESNKNFKDAKKYYYEAAKEDDLEGQFSYAEIMKAENVAKAEYWYNKSASQGHLKSKFMLGEIAFQDDQYGKAQKYYTEVIDSKELVIDNEVQTPKSITKKDENTIKLNLTYIYFKIDKDNKKAKKTVPRDIPMGQAYLGQIFMDEGKIKESKKWMKKSADNGYEPARQFLKDNFK